MRSEILRHLSGSFERLELVVLGTVVAGPEVGRQMLVWPRGETFGDLGSPRLNQRAALFAEQIIPARRSSRKIFRSDADEVDVFFEVCAPPPELVVVGAVHIAVPLITMARVLGYHTTVMDPRGAFATDERFAEADRLLRSWPQEGLAEIQLHESSCLVVLSHDLKIDLPALEVGLQSPCRYIGALGSKKTHAKRIEALLERGCTAREIERIHAPVGLDLGGREPEQIALAILAEMVASEHGRPTLESEPG